MGKEFICLDCKWATTETKHKAYCNKVGFACNGPQFRPTQICEDYEPKED